MANLIAISGKIGAGKDTVAYILNALKRGDTQDEIFRTIRSGNYLPLTEPYEIRKFASGVKKIAAELEGVSPLLYESQDFKRQRSEASPHLTNREFLMVLGEGLRNLLGEDIWVNYTFNGYTPDSHWIITDLRYKNEAEKVLSHKGTLIRINADQRTFPTSKHKSEIDLDDFTNFSFTLTNNKGLKHLISQVAALPL